MASQTITGDDLQYTQDNKHCYAYAGLFGSNTSEFNMLNFTTGSGYIVGQFVLNGSVLFTGDSHLGGYTAYKISFNDVAVSTVRIDTTGTDTGQPITNKQPVVIPPFTNVVLTCIGGEVSATEQVSAYFEGRVSEYLPVRN